MPSFAGARELGGLLGAGRNLLTGAGLFVGPELFQQGRSGSLLDRGVQNLPGIIPDPRTDAGRNLGRMLSNELRYMGGQLTKGQIPYTQPAAGTQRPPMPGLPVDYKQTELAAGAAAERFRPGAGFPGQQAAAERAYQQEKARVAQLTAQDPELQRYENARAGAKTQEEMNAARDIGMQIWQQKYGNTPMGQPGGAVGMRNPLMDRTFGYQSGSAPDQQMGAPTLGPSPLVPQVDQSLNPASPNFIGGEGAPIMNFADPRFENMSPEEFQKLLNQVNKK